MSIILSRFHATGSVGKKIYPRDRAFRKLTYPAQMLIVQIVLHEIQAELLLTLMLEVDKINPQSADFYIAMVSVTKK